MVSLINFTNISSSNQQKQEFHLPENENWITDVCDCDHLLVRALFLV